MASPGSVVALGPRHLADAFRAFAGALRTNQAAINRLNVYPVPDGDTGTNLALTLRSAVEAIDALDLAGAELDPGAAMAAVCRAVSQGSLLGGRGNSGVIMSQILKGMATVFSAHDGVDGAIFTAALREAADAAYGAVMRPVEGTILTVVRRAAESAEAAGDAAALAEVLEAAGVGAELALDETPKLLPVLAQAGVVDAGGAGLCLLFDALRFVVDGRSIPVLDPTAPAGPADLLRAAATNGHGSGEGGSGEGGSGELRYEVMYLLEAPDASVPGFKDVWAGLGDSIVVVGGDGLWNCHIHTDDIGAAIEAAIDIGRPRNIRVTDLAEQVAELEDERWVREASAAGLVDDEPPHAHEPCATAVVAVATGDGVRRLFLSLGVQRVVTGGQSMNPSTEQLLAAVERCPAPAVVILPNNKNIVAVARQVDALTAKAVRVVESRSVTEGLAAAMQYDPEGDVEVNAMAMHGAVSDVVSGEITTAVRDSFCDAGPIRAGDHLGIARDAGIVAVAPALADAATGLLAAIVSSDHEIVTMIEGEGASAAETRRIREWLEDHRPGVACEVHHGGQPLYPYLFGVE